MADGFLLSDDKANGGATRSYIRQELLKKLRMQSPFMSAQMFFTRTNLDYYSGSP